MGGDFLCDLHLNPPPWVSEDTLSKITSMTRPTPDQAARLKQEWDVPIDDEATPLSTLNELRSSFKLWNGLVTQGTVLDFICGELGLGDKLRASKLKKNPSAPTASKDPAVSMTTVAGGEDALVDLAVIPDEAKKFFPQLCLDSTFPPTHLSHGVNDLVVLPSESVRHYDQLKALGVDVQLALVEGQEHMFERGQEDDPVIRKVLDGLVNFLVRHLEA